MSDPFLGEIRMFSGTFAPRNWAFCNGALLDISSYSALFSLLGTTYGGDGRISFALPDLRGRLPVHQGPGPGLTERRMGQRYGSEKVTLSTNEIPPHNHPMQGSNDQANSASVKDHLVANIYPDITYISDATDLNRLRTFRDDATETTGSDAPHENRMPFLCLNYIICMQGTFPSRN